MYKVTELKSKDDDEYNAWKELKAHNIVPINKSINNIDINLNNPLKYAVVTDTEIPLYFCANNTKIGNVGNFKNANCCKFRADGEMMIVGTKSGEILLLAMIKMGNIIRKFSAHNGAINKIEYLYKFEPVQKLTATVGDDGTLQIWDINDSAMLHKFSHSQEPLRALAVHKNQPSFIATGSMDGFIRLYNIELSDGLLVSINTQKPVSSVLFPWEFREDFMLSAGQSSIQLWNASELQVDSDNNHVAIQSRTPHHMHIMDMCVSDGLYSGETVVFTAGLDGLVKVTSLGDFREIFKFEYPSSLMAIKVLPHSQYLIVAGNVIGDSSQGHIYTRKLQCGDESNKDQSKFELYRGLEQQKIIALAEKYNEGYKTIQVVEHVRKVKLPKFEKLIKKHKHRVAFTTALKSKNRCPEFWQKVIRELICLGALKKAVAKRNSSELTIMMKIISKNFWIPRFTRTFLHLLNIILEVYPRSEIVNSPLFKELRDSVTKSVASFNKFEQIVYDIKDMVLSFETSSPSTFAKVDCSFPVSENLD